MSDPTFGIRIVGNNQVDAGARAAERRLTQVPRRVGEANRRHEREGRASLRRQAGASIRTMGQVERAGARIFGTSSMMAGMTARLGGVTAAASALGTGMGQAAAGGGMLSGAIGMVGVAAGATIGILAAAGYAAFKLSNGWAKGAASIGRTAELIGVGTKALQGFSAAAERVGVDKDKATGALGGLSQTLNDARYGRNNEALEVLARLKVGMKTNADGTVDVAGMLPEIADAIARQNSSGRRTAARHLGIPLEALAVFTQGGKQLGADMKDADRHAVMISDGEIGMAKRVVRKGARVGQLKDRVVDRAGKIAAENSEWGYDKVLQGGLAIADGADDFGGTVKRFFKPATDKFDRAVDRIGGAVRGGDGGRGAGRLTQRGVLDKARQGARLVPKLMALGLSRPDAIALASNAAMESGANHRAREKGGGGGVGLFQITDRARKALFRRTMGVPVERSSEDQQLRYQVWELKNSEARNWRRAHANGSDAPNVSDGYARYVERPANKARDGAERAAVAEAMTIHLNVSGLPQGATVTAKGQGAKPAVSYAWTMKH